MKLQDQLDNWSEQNHAPWMDILRMILGVLLIAKGYLFIADTQNLTKILDMGFGLTSSTPIAMGIAYLHLLCGFLILIGLATRVACVIQIPIVFAAIIFVNLHGEVNWVELGSSLLVFLLLIFFVLKGSGKFSVYYYMANSRRGRVVGKNPPATGAPLTSNMDKHGNL